METKGLSAHAKRHGVAAGAMSELSPVRSVDESSLSQAETGKKGKPEFEFMRHEPFHPKDCEVDEPERTRDIGQDSSPAGGTIPGHRMPQLAEIRVPIAVLTRIQ